MQRVFKTRYFDRWQKKTPLGDSALCQAIDEMVSGLIDANLSGNIVKKRIALPGKGKRGGLRTLLATKNGGCWYFLFGFSKNQQDNINQVELEALRTLADSLLKLTPLQISAAVTNGTLMEICHDHQNPQREQA